MSKSFEEKLSRSVNAEARRQYQRVAELLGTASLLTTVAPRLALRAETEYPYSFSSANELIPPTENGFGRVINRGRQEGLEEIHDTIGQQTKERNWLYVPDGEFWVDTTLRSHEATAEPDRYAHIFLSHLYPEIESVHTHPDLTVQHLAQTDPWSYSENYLIEAARPSGDDLVSHVQMAARTSPESHQVGSIVSHYGVTSYALHENERGGFMTEAYDRAIGDPSDPIAAIRLALDSLSEHTRRFEGPPAFDIDFEPINH